MSDKPNIIEPKLKVMPFDAAKAPRPRELGSRSNEMTVRQKVAGVALAGATVIAAGSGIHSRFDSDRVMNPTTPTDEQRDAVRVGMAGIDEKKSTNEQVHVSVSTPTSVHKVEVNDTLWGIAADAKQHGAQGDIREIVDNLADQNGGSAAIQPGQELSVPVGEGQENHNAQQNQ